MLHARGLRCVVVRECAFGLVVAADARVLVGEMRRVIAEPQRLVEGDCVIELPVREEDVARRRRHQWPPPNQRMPITTVCRVCQGSGWITGKDRTLEFADDGFVDVDRPARMCSTCGGTGTITRTH